MNLGFILYYKAVAESVVTKWSRKITLNISGDKTLKYILKCCIV
jgi:hypothetical protein